MPPTHIPDGQTLAEIAKALQLLARVDIQNDSLARQVLELRKEQRVTLSTLHAALSEVHTRVTNVEAAIPVTLGMKRRVARRNARRAEFNGNRHGVFEFKDGSRLEVSEVGAHVMVAVH